MKFRFFILWALSLLMQTSAQDVGSIITPSVFDQLFICSRNSACESDGFLLEPTNWHLMTTNIHHIQKTISKISCTERWQTVLLLTKNYLPRPAIPGAISFSASSQLTFLPLLSGFLLSLWEGLDPSIEVCIFVLPSGSCSSRKYE